MPEGASVTRVELDGRGLTLGEVRGVALGRTQVFISPIAWEKVRRAADYVSSAAKRGQSLYGVTTGFGAHADVVVPPEQARRLQENLLISHACGVGEPFPPEVVRLSMLFRINTLLHGHSGITDATLRLLVTLLNRRILPVIPSQGSVGASGDLAPLSHMALPLIGRGFVTRGGKTEAAADALKAEGLEPVALTYKEGLALTNGTQVMTALGAMVVYMAEDLVRVADIAGAISLEALCGRISPFDHRLHALRPHLSQIQTASNIRRLISGSCLAGIPCESVPLKRNLPQDSYSLRCIPQVHGASRQGLAFGRQVLETEMNSVTDNPILFPEDDDIISGGNFHGQPIAMVLDHLKLVLSNLGNISERRSAKLVDKSQNDGLPPFLIEGAGVNSGLMLPQYTAAALASENKTLAHPCSVDTIPTSANTEDHVSMGPIGGRHAMAIAVNVRRILAIEVLTALQGLDLRLAQLGMTPADLGGGARAARALVRGVVPFAESDRDYGGDINTIDAMIEGGYLLDAVEAAIGPLAIDPAVTPNIGTGPDSQVAHPQG